MIDYAFILAIALKKPILTLERFLSIIYVVSASFMFGIIPERIINVLTKWFPDGCLFTLYKEVEGLSNKQAIENGNKWKTELEGFTELETAGGSV